MQQMSFWIESTALKTMMDQLNDNQNTTIHSFIRKVFIILMLQLLIVGVIVVGIMGSDYITELKLTTFDRSLSGIIIGFLLPILMIILTFPLVFSVNISQRISACSYFLLSIFTIFHAIMLGLICTFSKHYRAIYRGNGKINYGIIFIAVGISATIILGITVLLAVQIKWTCKKCLKMFLVVFLYIIITFLIVVIALLNFMLNNIFNNVQG